VPGLGPVHDERRLLQRHMRRRAMRADLSRGGHALRVWGLVLQRRVRRRAMLRPRVSPRRGDVWSVVGMLRRHVHGRHVRDGADVQARWSGLRRRQRVLQRTVHERRVRARCARLRRPECAVQRERGVLLRPMRRRALPMQDERARLHHGGRLLHRPMRSRPLRGEQLRPRRVCARWRAEQRLQPLRDGDLRSKPGLLPRRLGRVLRRAGRPGLRARLRRLIHRTSSLPNGRAVG
jgi:hypothetical protein